ncbi:uncharacterized protein Tco_0448584 [Tanacetum coccineum]
MFSTNTSFLDLLSSFTPDPNSQPALPNDDTFGTFDECNSQYSDNNSESNSDIGDESDDGCEVATQSHSQGVMDFINDIGDASDEDADNKSQMGITLQECPPRQNKKFCNTPLPHRMWRKFSSRDIHAQSHHLSEYNYNEGVYMIVTKLRINDTYGNTHTVCYFQQTCTCGKWQMERFPCSHALAVCRHRGDNPLTIIHTVYTTATFKQQYLSDFTPLPHVDYWLNSGWKIKADNSKINVSRGRKKSSRIRNEMDIRHPDEPKRCGLCRQTGHNRSRCTNSQPRFNSA